MGEIDIGVADLLGIAVVGAALSYAIEWVKGKWGADGLTAKWITLLLSVVVGGSYWWLRSTPWWATILGVLGASSVVYGFFVKK